MFLGSSALDGSTISNRGIGVLIPAADSVKNLVKAVNVKGAEATYELESVGIRKRAGAVVSGDISGPGP